MGKFSSQTTVCLLVLMICNLRGEKVGGSPAPAIATRLELKSISQMPAAAPSSAEK